MLSDVGIEKLIAPVLQRQEEINRYVIQILAKKLREISELSESDLFKLNRLFKSGADVKKLNKELARLTGLQVRDIKKIIRDVARDSYISAKPFYDYRNKSFIPFSENEQLQRIVKAIEAETAGSYINLSNSKAIGFITTDLKHPTKFKFTPIKETYNTVVDRAIQASVQGVVDYNTAIRGVIKELTDSGVRRLYWESGYSQRLDTAVKRNVLDGIKKINQQVQNQIGEEIGADGIELTAHANPAPDHERVQGRVFTAAEFDKYQEDKQAKDVTGHVYQPGHRAIGQYNCRHLYYRIILDGHVPVYTEKQLKKIIEDNHRGYTLPNGKHLTGYECLQYQNKLALRVRQAKDRQIAARIAGDMEYARKAQADVNQLTKNYNAFVRQVGISRNAHKLTVSGYQKISVK